MAIPAIGTSTGSTNLAQTIAGNQTLGQDEFLKLMITQLTNQDPLSPQDDKEFIAQMAQFSSVEGIKNLDTSLNKAQAASIIDRKVDAQIMSGGQSTTISGVAKAVTYQADGVHVLINTKNGDSNVLLSDLTKVSG
jgi:flagellar basal-body rod modification protein FlgD